MSSQGDGFNIAPISIENVESFHQCLDSVARERRFLGLVKAPPLEKTREFVFSNIRNKVPQFIALDGDRVVGWCDLEPNKREGFTHCGTLGMGILTGYRRRGIGTKLMESTIVAAKKLGIERI